MADVFLSYSRKDSDFVKRLHDGLAKLGRDVWVDWEDIPLTADWWREIRAGIEAADTFIFIISPDSVASPICNLEIAHARENHKRLVPVVRVPAEENAALTTMLARPIDDNTRQSLNGRDLETLAKENWQALARHNWLFFRDDNIFETAFKQLISAIETDLNHLRSHTRLLVRAKEWENAQKSPGYLLRGEDLQQAESWLAEGAQKDPPATALHNEYIFASRRAASRRQRLTLGGVFAALLVSMVLTVIALLLYQDAAQQRNTAQRLQQEAEIRAEQSELIAQAQQARQISANGDPLVGLALAFQTAQSDYQLPQVQSILAEMASSPGIRAFLGDLDDYQGAVYGVSYSPDGKFAAAGLEDGRVLICDTETFAQEHELTGHEDSVRATAFSPDGRYLISGAADTSLMLWDVTSGELLRQFWGHEAAVLSVAFSSDGKRVASSSDDSTVRLWDVQTGELLQTLSGHKSAVTDVAFAPSADELLSGSLDSSMILWDLRTGRAIRTFLGHKDGVTSVAFSPDGMFVASGSLDDSVILWNTESTRILGDFSEHTDDVNDVAFSSNGAYLVSASADKTLLLWDRNSQRPLIRQFTGHEKAVLSVNFSPDGRYLTSGSRDAHWILWDVEGLKLATALQDNSAAFSVAFSPDGKRLLADSANNTVLLTDMDTDSPTFGTVLKTFTGHTIDVNAAAYSPNGRWALTGATDGTLLLWDVEAEAVDGFVSEPLRTFSGHPLAITGAAFSPDGTRALTSSQDRTLRLWDMTENGGTEPLKTLEGHTSDVNAVAYLPDGKSALSASSDFSLILWDLDAASSTYGQPIATFTGQTDAVISLAVDPEGTRALAGDKDGLAVLWDIDVNSPTFGTVIRILVEHTDDVTDTAFNHDGSLALTGSNDGTVRLWDIATGVRLMTYPIEGRVLSVAFSPDGQMAVAGVVSGSEQLIQLTIDTSESLVQRVQENRLIVELSCEDRFRYSVEPFCESGEVVPAQLSTPDPATDEDRVSLVASNITSALEGATYGTYSNFDSGVVAYGIYRFTLASGSLGQVVERYLQGSNSMIASELANYMPRIRVREESLRNDNGLKELLLGAANEYAMRTAQNAVALELYWNQILELNITPRNIQTPLGKAMLFDIGIQLGVYNELIQQAEEQLGITPNSRVGENGVTEEELIHKVAELRRDLLYRQAERNNLPGLRLRGDFWIELVQRGDWYLQGDEDGYLNVNRRRVQVRNP